MMQMQHDAPFSFSAVPASWALFILVSRTAANDNAAADSDGVTKSAGVHYKGYRRTYESSTISPRSSMMESEGKKKNGGRRKENGEAPTTQTYSWMPFGAGCQSAGMYRIDRPPKAERKVRWAPGAKLVLFANHGA